MAATLDTGTKALFRRHILKTLGWADARRDRKGNWFVKEQPRAENKFKSRWLPDRLFTDAELMGDLSDGRIKA